MGYEQNLHIRVKIQKRTVRVSPQRGQCMEPRQTGPLREKSYKRGTSPKSLRFSISILSARGTCNAIWTSHGNHMFSCGENGSHDLRNFLTVMRIFPHFRLRQIRILNTDSVRITEFMNHPVRLSCGQTTNLQVQLRTVVLLCGSSTKVSDSRSSQSFVSMRDRVWWASFALETHVCVWSEWVSQLHSASLLISDTNLHFEYSVWTIVSSWITRRVIL